METLCRNLLLSLGMPEVIAKDGSSYVFKLCYLLVCDTFFLRMERASIAAASALKELIAATEKSMKLAASLGQCQLVDLYLARLVEDKARLNIILSGQQQLGEENLIYAATYQNPLPKPLKLNEGQLDIAHSELSV